MLDRPVVFRRSRVSMWLRAPLTIGAGVLVVFALKALVLGEDGGVGELFTAGFVALMAFLSGGDRVHLTIDPALRRITIGSVWDVSGPASDVGGESVAFDEIRDVELEPTTTADPTSGAILMARRLVFVTTRGKIAVGPALARRHAGYGGQPADCEALRAVLARAKS